MITIEEKLNVFTKLVFERIQEESKVLLKEMEEKNQQIIEEQREKLKLQSEKLINDMAQKGETKKNQMIAKANMDRKIKILEKKKQLLGKLLQELQEKALAFTATSAYDDFFRKTLEEVLDQLRGEEEILLYIKEGDILRYQTVIGEIANTFGFQPGKYSLLPAEENILGGVVALSGNHRLRIDASLSALLQEHEKMVGQMLYNGLEKEGEVNE
ncbi:ATP synthase E subunit [Geosporobacter subterraneus DSM 17957]|uniref:ATP synthase E subunit n=1 Tax=Geosporobacter subterraneus DSM 17957 TaxID=1121919 RepID=A0A1M6MTM0_9FIRM|nr:V-type ATP synthase subunit E family protein [Geosporobacter subterraneus]SHJ86756.1 ATP synthase E subunit [Geosporobacter subterraneus DSM 17957]